MDNRPVFVMDAAVSLKINELFRARKPTIRMVRDIQRFNHADQHKKLALRQLRKFLPDYQEDLIAGPGQFLVVTKDKRFFQAIPRDFLCLST